MRPQAYQDRGGRSVGSELAGGLPAASPRTPPDQHRPDEPGRHAGSKPGPILAGLPRAESGGIVIGRPKAHPDPDRVLPARRRAR
jgi:hypothetical protein